VQEVQDFHSLVVLEVQKDRVVQAPSYLAGDLLQEKKEVQGVPCEVVLANQ